MRLSAIAENFLSQKMREAIVSSKALNDRPLPVSSEAPYEPSSGHDSGSQAAGATLNPTGVPHRGRHRRFFGMETRPGTIRL